MTVNKTRTNLRSRLFSLHKISFFPQDKGMERAERILKSFVTPQGLVRRDFSVGKKTGAMIYHPDLTDSLIITQLLRALEECNQTPTSIRELASRFVVVAEIKTISRESEAIEGVLDGDTLLLVDGLEDYLLVSTRKYDKRAVTEPPTSNIMFGPREGFIEDLKTNLSLIARRLRTTDLAVKRFKVGRYSGTPIAVVYLDGIAAKKTVDRIVRRLKAIDVDGVLDTNAICARLEERPQSIFPQSSLSEKPDVVASKLLEGRVAVLVDGSPMVLTLPFLLIEDFQSSEDYYQRSAFATLLRIVRVIGALVAVFLPGLYVALQVYHFNVIPMRFLLTLMSSVNGIPFKPLSETMFVILLFELIREAGVRTPRAAGMAMSIVGALVLGDTAVKAGVISSPAVMIVALSSLALYIVPNQVGTMSVLRIVYTLLGGAGGLYLLMAGVLYTVMYLTSLDSYDTPYLAPFAPFVKDDFKDSVVRVSLLRMSKRPQAIPHGNDLRQK